MTDDALLEKVRAEMRESFRRHDMLEDEAISRWASGKRKPNSWFIRKSTWGAATDTYGEGCRVYRTARDAVTRPLSREQQGEALALAVEVLNRLGFLYRYGGLRVDYVTCSQDSERDEAQIFGETAMADLGATLALLENFGGQPRPTPAEQRHNEQVKRAWREGRDNG